MALSISAEDVRERLDDNPSPLTDAQINKRVSGALAIARTFAPCLSSPNFDNVEAATEIVLRAVVYDLNVEAQQRRLGALTQTEQAGPFAHTLEAGRRGGTMFNASQIDQLRALCGLSDAAVSRRAHSVPLGFPLMPEGRSRRVWESTS